jgi:Flp pilus assembly protein TadD
VNYWRDSGALMSHAADVVKDNYLARCYLADFQAENGETREAIANYEEAMRHIPKNSKIIYLTHHDLAKLYSRAGQLDTALNHLMACIQIEPNKPDAYNNIGIIMLKMERRDLAVTYFRKALEVDPNYSIAQKNLISLSLSTQVEAQ